MRNKKKKGYILAVVLLLVLLMTIVIAATFTILMRYMFLAKDNLLNLSELYIIL